MRWKVGGGWLSTRLCVGVLLVAESACTAVWQRGKSQQSSLSRVGSTLIQSYLSSTLEGALLSTLFAV